MLFKTKLLNDQRHGPTAVQRRAHEEQHRMGKGEGAARAVRTDEPGELSNRTHVKLYIQLYGSPTDMLQAASCQKNSHRKRRQRTALHTALEPRFTFHVGLCLLARVRKHHTYSCITQAANTVGTPDNGC